MGEFSPVVYIMKNKFCSVIARKIEDFSWQSKISWYFVCVAYLGLLRFARNDMFLFYLVAGKYAHLTYLRIRNTHTAILIKMRAGFAAILGTTIRKS